MYFKKLELLGFKSFCDKTVLHFEPGITAVVGPNGCGKSNIFDSIRWVLGEQSAKSLRGSDMQDVIFNGTDKKEGLGMAEVTLTFDNEKKFFPVDHPEVAITRRIFRSGESEYLLNKTLVRLKDIIDLLAGTGIGAESYSLVAQGKIDLILSSRPEDRRMVFDEASGITKYKSQKREALRKLEETEQNLLRINDIVAEVKRQIGSLERQASKARRYKEVFEELKTKELNLAVFQRGALLKEKNEIIKQLTELQAQEETLLVGIKGQEERIANHKASLKSLEDKIMDSRKEALNLDNQITRNRERITFNREKTAELEAQKDFLQAQIKQNQDKLRADEEKLNKEREEYEIIRSQVQGKSELLKEREGLLDALLHSIKLSSEKIASAKKDILELSIKTAKSNTDIADLSSKEQIYLARKKRLELELAKLKEEKIAIEDSLNGIKSELTLIREAFESAGNKIICVKEELDAENTALKDILSTIESLEKQKLTLESHREFIEKLRTKYDDISESMNASIELDKIPPEQLSGLVIKIKSVESQTRLSGEAKPIDLDTAKITQKIQEIQEKIGVLNEQKTQKEAHIAELNNRTKDYQGELRGHELALTNKEALYQNVSEQHNKIQQEEEIIHLELEDNSKELNQLQERLNLLRVDLASLQEEQKKREETIGAEQNNISLNSAAKEEHLVGITQLKTELELSHKRLESENVSLKALEDTCAQDKESLENSEKQINDSQAKVTALALETDGLEKEIISITCSIAELNVSLKAQEEEYLEKSQGSSDVVEKIESEKKELDSIKNKLYELQLQDKDIEFKYQSIKERLLQAYRIALEEVVDSTESIEEAMLTEEIQRLKEKLDSYGTVNLVAIEEYDELKKRYDFLIQQQTDLSTAKESLHQAILKINRTTKQMFLETFEKVREEFRNYFRLLFNGGDAQIFLIDEQDPLESGIEIICRPPGKKLQNVLLLSGGEKALSAIGLIFAIFKVKPSPFCILDEIDAALDEANVDRFGRLLQEFNAISQFIVITHNKKTIANAGVMYGITMQESGISNIVSVKFAENKIKNKDRDKDKEQEPEPVAA